MAGAWDIQGIAFKNGSATLLARVVGANAVAITTGSLVSAAYTIYLLDPVDPDAATAVEGHEDVAVEVADLIFDTLQTDAIWDVDSTGYNLKHILDITTNAAFAVAGRTYLVVFSLTPTGDGQVITARFRVRTI
jgi:hypothetical protein